MGDKLCTAIAGRHVITLNYGGGERTLEPHCHGTSRKGHESLRAYQTGGFSRRNEPVGWKFLTVEKMSDSVVLDESFKENRDDYNPDDKHMITIHCCV